LGDFPDFSHPRAVRPSSGVNSFELDLFMSQIGAKLPDFFERFALEPMNQGEDHFRTAVLRSIFCSSPRSVQFAMFALPLAQNPSPESAERGGVYQTEAYCQVTAPVRASL
jgi:hypothetical protein